MLNRRRLIMYLGEGYSWSWVLCIRNMYDISDSYLELKKVKLLSCSDISTSRYFSCLSLIYPVEIARWKFKLSCSVILKQVVWVNKNNVCVQLDIGCCLMLMVRHYHIEMINLQIIIFLELRLTNLGKKTIQ